jgi:hypothetical protein
MCAPAVFAIGSLVVGLASSALQYVGAQRVANQQASYQNQMVGMEYQRAAQEQQQLLLKNQQEQASLRLRQAQEKEAATRELAKVSMEARAASSRAVVAAGEAGVTGLSVDALLGEIRRQELGYFETTTRQGQMRDSYYDQSLTNMTTGLGMNLETSRLASQMNVNQINRPIQKPSFASFMINNSSAVLGAGQNFYQNKYYFGGGGQGGLQDILFGSGA